MARSASCCSSASARSSRTAQPRPTRLSTLENMPAWAGTFPSDPNLAQLRCREALRTTKPAPRSVPPPATSSTTSRPVNGSCEFPREICCGPHVSGLYASQVELDCARAEAGAAKIAKATTSVAIRLMSSFRPPDFPLPRADARLIVHVPRGKSYTNAQISSKWASWRSEAADDAVQALLRGHRAPGVHARQRFADDRLLRVDAVRLLQ